MLKIPLTLYNPEDGDFRVDYLSDKCMTPERATVLKQLFERRCGKMSNVLKLARQAAAQPVNPYSNPYTRLCKLLDMLPASFSMRAVLNAVRAQQTLSPVIPDAIRLPSEALLVGFNWASTPEGRHWWARVYQLVHAAERGLPLPEPVMVPERFVLPDTFQALPLEIWLSMLPAGVYDSALIVVNAAPASSAVYRHSLSNSIAGGTNGGARTNLRYRTLAQAVRHSCSRGLLEGSIGLGTVLALSGITWNDYAEHLHAVNIQATGDSMAVPYTSYGQAVTTGRLPIAQPSPALRRRGAVSYASAYALHPEQRKPFLQDLASVLRYSAQEAQNVLIAMHSTLGHLRQIPADIIIRAKHRDGAAQDIVTVDNDSCRIEELLERLHFTGPDSGVVHPPALMSSLAIEFVPEEESVDV